jgi:hypothetical protein
LSWYRKEAGALVVTVRLTPKAHRDALEGIGVLSNGNEVVQARVRALPADGAANAALVQLFAKALRAPKSAIEIVAGHSQRLKQVRIAGDPHELVERIGALAKK